MLPEITRKNTPMTHYMPSSPFYGDKANDMLAGDSHVWSWTRLPNETGFAFKYELEAFDRLADKVRFSSEFGFYGALVRSSVERFHAGAPSDYLGDIWTYHGEHASKRRLIDETLMRHMADPAHLDADRYLLLCGALQGVLYEEMTLALRRRAHCSGQLIWMYNDCWPETGWTVIDYYLTRKRSFYFLKRAFAPCKLIAREQGGRLMACVINESPEAVAFDLEVGFVGFVDGLKPSCTLPIEIQAHARLELAVDVPHGDLQNGTFYLRANHPDFEPVTSLRGYYRDYDFPDAHIEILSAKPLHGGTELILRADRFVPMTYVALADDAAKLSDNFFPMLPGIEKTVWVEAQADCVRAEPVRFERAPQQEEQ